MLELGAGSPRALQLPKPEDSRELEKRFLSRLAEDQRDYGRALLDLGRASYKLRDDDNIYLGRIEAHYFAALREARARLDAMGEQRSGNPQMELLESALGPFEIPAVQESGGPKAPSPARRLKARQIVGQPAGPGLASGSARVIRGHEDLLEVKRNEVLICDAVDPNMTFIIPLVAAVVERRGGMLIHGAIIAREYGIPCVTGVPDATRLIRSGDRVTVDGFLGLVTLGSEKL